jgi:hypothetical protein
MALYPSNNPSVPTFIKANLESRVPKVTRALSVKSFSGKARRGRKNVRALGTWDAERDKVIWSMKCMRTWNGERENVTLRAWERRWRLGRRGENSDSVGGKERHGCIRGLFPHQRNSMWCKSRCVPIGHFRVSVPGRPLIEPQQRRAKFTVRARNVKTKIPPAFSLSLALSLFSLLSHSARIKCSLLIALLSLLPAPPDLMICKMRWTPTSCR